MNNNYLIFFNLFLVGKEFDKMEKKIAEDSETQRENELLKENEKKNLATYQKEMKELNKDIQFTDKKIIQIDAKNLLSLDGIFEMYNTFNFFIYNFFFFSFNKF
jgi:hypothetical protein